MIEAGRAGGSAAEQAAQRRAVAARLQAEADWLDEVAVDERHVAEILGSLPDSYVTLHDVRPPGSPSVVDHVVVGPGGAFLVAGRRYSGAVAAQGDELVVGGRPLNPELSGATAVAEVLSAHFGTPVVPVLCLHGESVPDDLPPTVAGVVVCAAADVAKVLTRSTHTLLAPHKVDEVVDRVRGLLVSPPAEISPAVTALPTLATTPRPVEAATSSAGTPDTPGSSLPSMSSLPASGGPTVAEVPEAEAPTVEIPRLAPLALVTPESVPSPVPVEPTPGGPAPLTELTASTDPVATSATAGPSVTKEKAGTPARDGKGEQPAKTPKPAKAPKTPKSAKAPEQKKATTSAGEQRGRSVAVGIIVAACLVAAAAGVAARVLLTDDGGDGTTIVPTTPAPQTTVVATSTTLAGPLAEGLEAPVVSFTAVCPGAGQGWNWVADWPGDLPGLDYYAVEFQNADGTWSPLAPLESAAVSSVSIGGQAPNVTVTVRVTAVMTDASTSPNQPTSFTSPTSPC